LIVLTPVLWLAPDRSVRMQLMRPHLWRRARSFRALLRRHPLFSRTFSRSGCCCSEQQQLPSDFADFQRLATFRPIRLAGGEEIRVPEAGKVFVVGNVKKPGAFVVHDPNEISVLKMLAVAEGLTSYASKEAFIIRRDDRTGTTSEIPVGLSQIMERKAPDTPLLANDILYVPDRTGRRTSMAVLERLLVVGGAAVLAQRRLRHRAYAVHRLQPPAIGRERRGCERLGARHVDVGRIGRARRQTALERL